MGKAQCVKFPSGAAELKGGRPFKMGQGGGDDGLSGPRQANESTDGSSSEPGRLSSSLIGTLPRFFGSMPRRSRSGGWCVFRGGADTSGTPSPAGQVLPGLTLRGQATPALFTSRELGLNIPALTQSRAIRSQPTCIPTFLLARPRIVEVSIEVHNTLKLLLTDERMKYIVMDLCDNVTKCVRVFPSVHLSELSRGDRQPVEGERSC